MNTEPRLFPLLPPDRRYWSRVDGAVGAEEAPEPPPEPSPSTTPAAVRALAQMRRDPRYRATPPEPPRNRPRRPSHAKLPVHTVRPLCRLIASAMLAVGVLSWPLWASDVSPRVRRRRQITPLDVEKALWVRATLPGVFPALLKTFVRRLESACVW